MNRQFSHQGFTVLEAIASIFIITLALTTGITIAVNVRNQTFATNQRILAVEVGSRIRDDLVNNSTYIDLAAWLSGETQNVDVTSSNCASLSAPFSCDVFTYTSDGNTYDTNVTITFIVPTIESINYQVIFFNIKIEYYQNRTLILDGIIYE